MQSIILRNWVKGLANSALMILEAYFLPMLIITIRIWMAKVFLNIGFAKLLDWSGTLLLFKYEYQLPVFNHVFWAVFSTATELVSPVLIFFGLFTRFASFPMLLLTAFMNFSYLHSTEHFYWMSLLTALMFFGPGKFSLDFVLRKKMQPHSV